jgi:DNA-binding CsgD family transcriptional regulator
VRNRSSRLGAVECAKIGGLETLNRIARSGEAVFAIDSGERIILWNRKCEVLLGRPARSVLGRRCYEVTLGRDARGNIYCHRSCAVAYQARERPGDPVHRFPLFIQVGGGGYRQYDVGTFAIPSDHPALSIVVHVVRDRARVSALEKRLSSDGPAGDPLWPLTTGQIRPVELTDREREILRCLARGQSNSSIADRLSISRATVRNHVQHVLEKLGVHNKLAAVAYAYRHNLIGPEGPGGEAVEAASSPMPEMVSPYQARRGKPR